MEIEPITIRSNGDELTIVPAEYKIDFDSLAGPDSGRSIDGQMHISWILAKTTKLTITLPPHKYNDPAYYGLFSLVQGQKDIEVTFFDYITQTTRPRVKMYCSQTSAGYSYLGLVTDASFELIEMKGDATVPHLITSKCVITVNAGQGGSAFGGGTYNIGTRVKISAEPDAGKYFSQWSDGNTSNPRTVIANGNATYTAQFTVPSYTISTAVTPTGYGTVTGGGTYLAGSTVTLTATPGEHKDFVQWSDGNTDNPRTITVNGPATYTAEFGLSNYNVSITISPSGRGTATGAGTYAYGSTATVTAIPSESYYSFSRWVPGEISDNPYSFTVTSDVSLVASFNDNRKTVYASVSPSGSGTVTGTGRYVVGSTAVLTVVPARGYKFVRWLDGSTDNPRSVTVTASVTYNAQLEVETQTTTITASTAQGYNFLYWTYPSQPSETYYPGETATIRSGIYGESEFIGWYNNGTLYSTDNPLLYNVTYQSPSQLEFLARIRYYSVTFSDTLTFDDTDYYIPNSTLTLPLNGDTYQTQFRYGSNLYSSITVENGEEIYFDDTKVWDYQTGWIQGYKTIDLPWNPANFGTTVQSWDGIEWQHFFQDTTNATINRYATPI